MSRTAISEGLTLLKRRDFARLFSAYFISYFGAAMAPIAMAFGVLELTGSTKDSAVVIAAPIIAQIFVLLLGGTLADRTSRQKLMVFADLLALTSQMTIAILFLTEQASVLTLSIFMLISGSAYALHKPATTGFIPQIVSRQDLQAANAFLGLSKNSAIMLGAATAGVLVATLGAGYTLLIDALTFGVSGLLILTLKPKTQKAVEKVSLIQDLQLGWKEFTSHTWLWSIIIQFAIMVAALQGIFALVGPAIARDQMGGAIDWGLIMAFDGLGCLAGGALALVINVKRPMLFATCCAFFFVLLPLVLAGPLQLWIVCIAAFFSGTAGQLYGVFWYTTLHKQIPANMLSRVSAYDHMGSIALAPLGILAAGFLYEEIGGRATALIAVAIIILPTLLILFVRDVRELTNEDRQGEEDNFANPGK